MIKRLWLLSLMLLLFGLAATAAEKSADVIPFVFYDSLTGLEYGLVGAADNYLGQDELTALSLDIAENGGRNLTAMFFFPHRDRRYGQRYPLALDLELSGGKGIADKFFGFGQDSPAVNYSSYDNTYAIVKLNLSRPVTERLVLEGNFKYSQNTFSNLVQGTQPVTPQMAADAAHYFYGGATLRYNGKDNNFNPLQGSELLTGIDLAPVWGGNSADFFRWRGEWRGYRPGLNFDHVLAARFQLVQLSGGQIPLYEYATLGGKESLRGYSLYRFRDKAALQANAEYRFPLIGQLGGVFFLDSGQVLPELSRADLNRWAVDGGFGLRFYLRNLVIRADYGVGSEGDHFYLFYDHHF